MHLRRYSICFIAVALMLPFDADAATVVVLETQSYENREGGGTATIYVEEDRLRIDSNEGGRNVTIIYRRQEDKPVYWIIDTAARTYYELDRETIIKTRRDMEESIEQMRKQLSGMPAAERERMERTMRRNMERMGFAREPITYTSVSRGVRVGDWECNHYQGEREGKKVEEVWAADPADMGIGREKVEVFGEMADLFEGTGQDMPAFFSFAREGREAPATYEGFPVVVVSYDAGKRREMSQVIEVREEALEKTFFSLPGGLRRQSAVR
jgi:hypothetical protein